MSTEQVASGDKVEQSGETGNGQQASEQPQFRKIADVLDGENQPSFSNFTGDKLAVYRLTALACGALCQKPETMPAEGIDLRFWYCHRVEMVAQNGGEVITPIRTVLIDKKGNAWGFVSDAMPKELDTLRQVFGEGPYSDPLLIKVSKITTRKGFSTYTIAPV